MTRHLLLLGALAGLAGPVPAQAPPAPAPTLAAWVSTDWGATDHNRCVPDVSEALAALGTPGDLLGFHRGTGRPLRRLFAHWQGIQRLPAGDGRWLVLSRSGADVGFALVRLASRPAGGERFGGNRQGGGRSPYDTSPPGSDRIVREFPAPPGHDHGGGMQVVGHTLAVPFETGRESLVAFYDLSDPEHPLPLATLHRDEVPAPGHPGRASAVGAAKLADGRYLLLVGERSSKLLTFYVSRGTRLDHDLAFDWVTAISGAVVGGFQNMNLVAQCDGALFLVGTHNTSVPPPSLGSDLVRWYRLANADDGSLQVLPVGSRQLVCRRCNFGAGAGLYVDPDGRLLLYAVEHNAGGPEGSIEMEEFRPVFRGTATAEADAWVEFYEDRRFDRRVHRLDGVDIAPAVFAWVASVSSIRWSIPPGWRLRLYDRATCTGRSLDLTGSGETDDLAALRFDDRLACARWYADAPGVAMPDPLTHP